MKRFWKEASIHKEDGQWAVVLDGRPVRTPARRAVAVPIRAMAEGIADEWNAQGEIVKPMTMPLMRAASTCLDRVIPEADAVRANLASFGGSDLLCYRATHPPALVARQAAGWNPVLDWAAERFGARLVVVSGVMHAPQPTDALTRLAEDVERHDPWALTGLSELVTISGSLVLGLAVSRAEVAPARAWEVSRIDEDWNVEQWGDDEDAAVLAARRERDFMDAAHLLKLIGHL